MKAVILICLAVGALAFPNVEKTRPVAFEPAVGFLAKGLGRGETPRIVGGSEASPHSHPHQISLQVNSGGQWYHSCGGSVLSNNRIVTAAHCVYGSSASSMRIVAGDHNLYASEGTEQGSAVASFVMHPQYNPNSYDYDYAVLRLSTALSLNSNVQAITLASSEPTSGNVVNTGWGDTSGQGTGTAERLQTVTIPLVPRSTCSSAFGGINTVTARMVCAGQSGRGPCKGDSGGPLTQNGQLVGIVSWGMVPCAQSQYPGVFSNVAVGRSWLLQQ